MLEDNNVPDYNEEGLTEKDRKLIEIWLKKQTDRCRENDNDNDKESAVYQGSNENMKRAMYIIKEKETTFRVPFFSQYKLDVKRACGEIKLKNDGNFEGVDVHRRH